MAHAIWSGAINFGLVSIPVKLFPAVREGKDLSFHLLHKKDKGRIKYARVCSTCGETVPWDEIVRGAEHEKGGDYVVVTDDELKKTRAPSTQSVDILEFCDLGDIDPVFFDKPYYLEPEKKGRHAYALLRAALEKSGKVGIARIVMRTREHLAAVKPTGDALVVEILHWADEIVDVKNFEFAGRVELPAAEMKTALMVIDTMTAAFDPEQFKDKYREELRELVAERAAAMESTAPKEVGAKSNVLDLMQALKASLHSSKTKHLKKHPAKARSKKASKKSAA